MGRIDQLRQLRRHNTWTVKLTSFRLPSFSQTFAPKSVTLNGLAITWIPTSRPIGLPPPWSHDPMPAPFEQELTSDSDLGSSGHGTRVPRPGAASLAPKTSRAGSRLIAA